MDFENILDVMSRGFPQIRICLFFFLHHHDISIMCIAYFGKQKLFLLNPIFFLTLSEKFYRDVRLHFLKLFAKIVLQKKNKIKCFAMRESSPKLAQAHLSSKP